jgi:putative heme iron utilization protein
MSEDERELQADVVETPLDQLLESVANRLEEQTSDVLATLRQEAARLREETATSVATLRDQAARLREERDFKP